MQRDEILDLLREYKDLFGDKYGILALGLFGSFARNEAQVDSDVDICIRTTTPNPFNLVHIKEDLEKQFVHPVDIIRIRDHMNPDLKERIEREAQYV